jgi:hypothetical protein
VNNDTRAIAAQPTDVTFKAGQKRARVVEASRPDQLNEDGSRGHQTIMPIERPRVRHMIV